MSEEKEADNVSDVMGQLNGAIDQLIGAMDYMHNLPPFSQGALGGVMNIALTGQMGRALLRIVEGIRLTEDPFYLAGAEVTIEELQDISERLAFNLRALMIGAKEDYGQKESGTDAANNFFDDVEA